MEPRIRAGDVVLSRALSPEAPTPLGRVVTFKAPPGSAFHGDVLHRVVAINGDGSLATKGDANAQPDSAPLARRDIVSSACLLIPWVGLPFLWVNTGAFGALGIWVLLTLVALLVAMLDATDQPQTQTPPGAPGPPSGSVQNRESLADTATAPTVGPPAEVGAPIPPVAERVRLAHGRQSGIAVAVLAFAALAIAPLGSASAAFSATTGSVGNSFAVSGPSTRLAFTSNPSSATGGVPFSTQPAVAVQDAGGDTVGVSSAQVTLAIVSPVGATLTCASNPAKAAAGIATFTGCRINTAGTYTLTATSGSLASAISTSFTISTGPASKLAFTTSPSGSTSGLTFSTQPVVAVQDAGGNTVTSSSASVTLSITPPAGGAILTCAANPKAAATGIATFSGCGISGPGTYTVTAVSTGLSSATSASFTIVAQTATKLAFAANPSSSTGGTAFATQPVVTVQDANGNTVTSSTASVMLSLTTPAGATLACTNNPRIAAAGVASFAGCTVNKVGTYTLTATSSGLTDAVSGSFAITVGPATQLGFTRVPGNTAVNTAFALQPLVAIQDAGGNTRTASSASVTLAITPPTGGAALTGCTANPRSTSSGVATFAGCAINTAGTYTLTATASGLTTAISTTITIYGPATSLNFTTAPSDGTGGTVLPVQPVVTVRDSGGRTVGNSTASVTLSITTPGGATLACTSNPKAAVAGVTSFGGCKLNKAGTYTLTAVSSGLTSAVSASFTITVGPATKLVFTTSPSGSTGGTAFATQPVVTVQDAGGNTVTSSGAPVDLSLTTAGGAILTCTEDPKNAASGVAAFAGCRVTKTGTYTLTAVSSGLTNAVSTSFTITVGPATQLAFTTSPSGAPVNTSFGTQPVVTVQDAGGNTVTTSGPSVTLSITPPAGGAILTCSANPRSTSSGVATFSTCRINAAGTYTLTATSGSLTTAVSNNLTIT